MMMMRSRTRVSLTRVSGHFDSAHSGRVSELQLEIPALCIVSSLQTDDDRKDV